MREEDKSSVTSFITGAFVGGVVGAALAVLFTPVTGEEARDVIKKKARQVGRKVDDFREDLEPKVAKVKREVKQKIREMVD